MCRNFRDWIRGDAKPISTTTVIRHIQKWNIDSRADSCWTEAIVSWFLRLASIAAHHGEAKGFLEELPCGCQCPTVSSWCLVYTTFNASCCWKEQTKTTFPSFMLIPKGLWALCLASPVSFLSSTSHLSLSLSLSHLSLSLSLSVCPSFPSHPSLPNFVAP